MKNLIYFNAGLDIEPLKYFPDIHEFTFVDTLPLSKSHINYFDANEYQHNFFNNLVRKLGTYGFNIINYFELSENPRFNLLQRMYYSLFDTPKYIYPSKLTFINYDTNQVLNYYINIKYTDYKCIDIDTPDVLFTNETLPRIEILDHFKKPKIFITEKIKVKESYETILPNLHYTSYFNKFYIYRENYLIPCTSFVDLLKKMA